MNEVKVTIKVQYAGKEVEFKDITFESPVTWEAIWNDFMGNFYLSAIDQATGIEVN